MQGKLTEYSSPWYRYLLYEPLKTYEAKLLPLVLFLHGSGEKGNNTEKIKAHGLPKLIASGRHFPFFLIAPQCSLISYWQPVPLKKLLDSAINELPIDKNRIYCTGMSMGGYGAWSLAIKYPDLFAAIIPICGGGDEKQVYKIKDVPIWVFHGAKDTVVLPEESEVMVRGLEKVKGNVKLTMYPDLGHDSWTRTYGNPEVLNWMLKQHKTSPSGRSKA